MMKTGCALVAFVFAGILGRPQVSAQNGYIAQFDTNNMSVIDTATNRVITTIRAGQRPYGVAVTPDGSKVYVANTDSNNVSVIATARHQVTARIPVGNRPLGVAVTPDGSNIYIANNNSPTFSRPGTVSVIDTATNTVIGSAIPVGISPDGVAVTSDGSKVYVSNGGSNNVSVIDTATKMVVATIPVGASPVCFGLCIQPAMPGAEIRGNAGEGELSSPERLGARQAVWRPQ